MVFTRRWLICAILLALAGCNTNATPPPIVIGHVSDKTRLDKAGDQAEFGIRLALHDLTKDGALAETFGGRSIVVHHTNTEGNVDAFESQAVRLFSVNRAVALVGGLSAQEVTALDHVKAPILTFHGQPVTGTSSQVFYLGMSARRQGEILAKVLADEDTVNRIVILQDERRSEANVLAEALQKTITESSKKPPMIATVRFGKDANWNELAERMTTPAPQAIVFAGNVQDFNAWHRVWRKDLLRDKAQIVYAGNDGDARLFELDPAGETKVLLASAYFADPASEKLTAFRKAFVDSNQQEPDVHAVLAYDGLRMLVEALKATAAQLTPEKIREELLKTKDFAGLTGPLTIPEDRQVRRPLFALQWQGGKLSVVKAFP